MNRYETSQGMSNWLRLTDKELSAHYESEKLREYGLRYCTKLSYAEVEQLVRERCGSSRLSDQRLYQMVQEKAAHLKSQQEALIAAREIGAEEIKTLAVDVYDAQEAEVIWLADGVCVSEQKARRDKAAKTGKERTTTEMVMLQRKDGSYRTLVAGQGVRKVDYYRAEVVKEYGEQARALPVVAISDGARSIKNETKKVFGPEVCHILDWYHLEAKVYQLMTQIAPNKEVKEECQQLMIEELWQGASAQAIKCLESIAARNEKKRDELKGYLEKNQAYLINYEKRYEAGKLIGSGRMEKQNDVIVAHRQKRKGMSWSKNGSLSLAMVTAHFNQRTNYLQ